MNIKTNTKVIYPILIYLALIVYPFLLLSVPPVSGPHGDINLAESAIFTKFRYLAMIFLAAGFLLSPFKFIIAVYRNVRRNVFTKAFISITILILLMSLFLMRIEAFIQAVILLMISTSFIVFFDATEIARKRFYTLLIWLLSFHVLLSLVLYWPPQGRWMGGIHPNTYSQVLIICTVLVMACTRVWRLVAVPLFLALAIAVSSRYGILSILFAIGIFTTFKALQKVDIPTYVIAILLAFAIGAVIVPELNFVREIFKLDDVNRGLGSGMTGRADFLLYFSGQLAENPLTGFGFRQRGAYQGVHNGFLNTVLENGILISAMLAVLIIVKYFTFIFQLIRNAAKSDFHTIEQRIVFCIFSVTLLSAFFQPQLINFGDIMGVMVIFCLSYPITMRSESGE